MDNAAALEANKEVMRRYIEEIFNLRKYEVIDELIHPDFVADPPCYPERWEFQSYKDGVPPFLAAFPDAHWTIEDMVAEGNKVAVILRFRGTHSTDDLMGVPPTGKEYRVMVCGTYEIVDGKIIGVRKANVGVDFFTAWGLPRPGDSTT